VEKKTILVRGELISLDRPLVMGILNVTPDSFYAGSRKEAESEIHSRIQAIREEGGAIVDIGGYSSRPGAADVPEAEEMERLSLALRIAGEYPGTIVSVDTFRANIARRSVEEYGAAIINDISGGSLDPEMFRTVAKLQVPYILMHSRGTPRNMQEMTGYGNLLVDIRKSLAEKVHELELLGVNDIIIDPGFGFGKTLEQNYELMASLDGFGIFGLPLLVGISRKSMIYNLSGTTPGESLNGTTVLNTLALLNGADILRVHDVKEAVETIRIVSKFKEYKPINGNYLLCGHKSE
jgi:dihydropteroate synthase